MSVGLTDENFGLSHVSDQFTGFDKHDDDGGIAATF